MLPRGQRLGRYRLCMPDSAPRSSVSGRPEPGTDPRSIRESLPTELVGEFDAEWALVMDRTKTSMELAGLHEITERLGR